MSLCKSTHFGRLRRVLALYLDNLGSFKRNARLYLLSVVLTGAAVGVFRLLFNFYVLSLGYDEALLGNLIAASSLTSLLVALPMGYLADFLGRKAALIISGLIVSLSTLLMVISPSVAMLVTMNITMGAAHSLSGVTMGPFLMENSTEKERTYLFSFSQGFMMASGFVGNWVGGYLPGAMGLWQAVDATSSIAYGWSLLALAAVHGLGVLPLFLLRASRRDEAQRCGFVPLSYFFNRFNQLGRLVLPILITSIGAGLFMPFMNVFYRQVHNQPDPAIGSMFAWGSLAMGIGLMMAPPLAERCGKIQVVVFTQGVSIPFLVLLGFSPWFGLSALAYYARLTLMNMSTPVYQTYVMERVDPSARATAASLVNMAHNFGWALSPTISGWIQVHYGFNPVFIGVLILYSLSVYLYWDFFLRRKAAGGGKRGVVVSRLAR